MDLPTCPACGQSVLDDDPEVCPFCGSSMKGKSSSRSKAPASSSGPASAGTPGKSPPSRPAQSRPTAANPQASKPVASKPSEPDPQTAKLSATGSKPTTPGRTFSKSIGPGVDVELPFDMSDLEQSRAVPVAPQPLKGRTYEVRCPMCETVGYVPRKAIGQPVRCANKECMVPVFTVPVPKKVKVDEEEETSAGMNWGLIVSGILVLAITVGGAWYFISQRRTANGPIPGLGQNGTTDSKNGANTPTGDGTQNTGTEGSDGTPKVDTAPKVSLAELRPQVLDYMDRVSLSASGGERGPYCRRLSSIAFAQSGDVKSAQFQRERLASMSLDQPFFQIAPYVHIAWQQLKSGQTDEAATGIEKAWVASKTLPSRGRDRLDWATQLASILVAVNRDQDAMALISSNQEKDENGQSSARLHKVFATKHYDYDHAMTTASLFPTSQPQTVAVTVDLVAHGRELEARRWADLQTDASVREECYIAWAETCALLHADATKHFQDLESIVGKWSPARQAELYARAAIQLAYADNKEDADVYGQKSAEILKNIAQVAPPQVPEAQNFFDYSVPNQINLKTTASAALALAHVEHLLEHQEASWLAIQQCLASLRASSFSVAVINNIDNRAAAGRNSDLAAELRRRFGLSNNDAVERKLRDYRQKARNLLDDAQERLRVETRAMQLAVRWGMQEQVWQEVQTRVADTSPQTHVAYMQSPLPTTLLEKFRDTGNETAGSAVLSRMEESGQQPDRWEHELAEARRNLAKNQPTQAASHLENLGGNRLQRGEATLQLACWAVKETTDAKTALKLVKAYNDEQFREQALEVVVGLATLRGKAIESYRWIQETSLNSTETVSGLFGLVIASLGVDTP